MNGKKRKEVGERKERVKEGRKTVKFKKRKKMKRWK